MLITTVTQKGQFTIPVPIRKKLDLKTGDKVISELTNGGFMVRPAIDFFSLKGFIKSKHKFSQKLLKEEEKAAEEYVVQEYLKKEKRMKKNAANY